MEMPPDSVEIEYERLGDGESEQNIGAELFFVCFAVCLALSIMFTRALYLTNNVVEAEIVDAGRAQ
jgi:hypothetical protein